MVEGRGDRACLRLHVLIPQAALIEAARVCLFTSERTGIEYVSAPFMFVRA